PKSPGWTTPFTEQRAETSQLVCVEPRAQIENLLAHAARIAGVRNERQVALQTADRFVVRVELHRERGAIAELGSVAIVEDQQPVDRRRGTLDVVTREIRRLQLREPAREDRAA